MTQNDADDTERPNYEGIMSATVDEGDVVWVHTSQTLGKVEGETIDEYARIRVIETRTVRSRDTDD